MKTCEELKRFGVVMKLARIAVIQSASAYTEKCHYCRPTQEIDEEVCFCVFGSTPALGFVVVNEAKKTIKAFDGDMELLKTLEIK